MVNIRIGAHLFQSRRASQYRPIGMILRSLSAQVQLGTSKGTENHANQLKTVTVQNAAVTVAVFQQASSIRIAKQLLDPASTAGAFQQ
ncbi:MAG: hypothetical protein R2911_31285 [Caldilineaceae bacterium]